MKNTVIGLLLLLTLWANSACGQNFYIRITPEAGFEAVDTIYQEFNQQQPQSILTILNGIEPVDIDYLISIRPNGQRLELMIQSPNWAAAQLARTLVVTFSYPTDVTEVMENFEQHESIEVVNYDYVLDPVNFNPENPSLFDPITLDLAFMPMSSCQRPTTNSQGLSYDVTTTNQTVELDVVANFPIPSTTICNLPTSLYRYELGQLSPGSYTININTVFSDSVFPVGENERYNLGSIEFVVRGPVATQVPANNFWFLMLLLGSMVLSTLAYLRKRHLLPIK